MARSKREQNATELSLRNLNKSVKLILRETGGRQARVNRRREIAGAIKSLWNAIEKDYPLEPRKTPVNNTLLGYSKRFTFNAFSREIHEEIKRISGPWDLMRAQAFALHVLDRAGKPAFVVTEADYRETTFGAKYSNGAKFRCCALTDDESRHTLLKVQRDASDDVKWMQLIHKLMYLRGGKVSTSQKKDGSGWKYQHPKKNNPILLTIFQAFTGSEWSEPLQTTEKAEDDRRIDEDEVLYDHSLETFSRAVERAQREPPIKLEQLSLIN